MRTFGIVVGFLGLLGMECITSFYVYQYLGIISSLCLITLSFFVGYIVLKSCNQATARQLKEESPVVSYRNIYHHSLKLLAAILILIPGMLTDIIGLFLLFPLIRELCCRHYYKQHLVDLTATNDAQLDKNL